MTHYSTHGMSKEHADSMVENNNRKGTSEDENHDHTIAAYKAILSIFNKGLHGSISEAPTYFFVIRELIVS